MKFVAGFVVAIVAIIAIAGVMIVTGIYNVAALVPHTALGPQPPDLAETGQRWNNAQLFWIVKNGIRMSGMPLSPQRIPMTHSGTSWGSFAICLGCPLKIIEVCNNRKGRTSIIISSLLNGQEKARHTKAGLSSALPIR